MKEPGSPLRVALVHDALVNRGGAERLAGIYCRAFPEAPLYTTIFLPGRTHPGFDPARVRTSVLQGVVRSEPFPVLPCTPEVCWQFGEACRYLKANGVLIGANDPWIAATAVVFAQPLVTANERHYRRVPGLTLLAHAR